MRNSSCRPIRTGLHPALLPILVGCSTALVVAFIGMGRRDSRLILAQQPAGEIACSQTSEVVPATSLAPVRLTDELQQVVLASNQSDSPDQDDRAFARHALRSLGTNPLIGQKELDAARKLYDDHDYVAGRKALKKLLVLSVERGRPIGYEEFDTARKLYDERDYVAARKAFQKLLFRKKNLPIEEYVLFYLAECSFHLGQYPDAQDGYDELLKKYSNARHFDDAIRRLFAIGCYWLDLPKSATEVELAAFMNDEGEERQGEMRDVVMRGESALKLNFTDMSKPFFNRSGRGIVALRSVLLHDPSGPLADDSVMILALYNLRKADYEEADIYFSQIRESYPKSEHLQDAYVLGAHACWKLYLESRSDGKQLSAAKKLTTSALRLFPDAPWQRHLKNQLQAIEAEEVERANAAKAQLN